jgi:hypothetical protein
MMSFGYIDPGTGSMVLQVLIAGVVGVIAFFRGTIARAFNWIKPKQNAPKDAEVSDAVK